MRTRVLSKPGRAGQTYRLHCTNRKPLLQTDRVPVAASFERAAVWQWFVTGPYVAHTVAGRTPVRVNTPPRATTTGWIQGGTER